MERAREARLRIRRVMAEDEGVYTCRAENAVGAVEASVSLIVHGEIHFLTSIFPEVDNFCHHDNKKEM